MQSVVYNSCGEVPLFKAARKVDLTLLQRTIYAGADVNIQDGSSLNTALISAAWVQQWSSTLCGVSCIPWSGGHPESIKESGVRESQECSGISFPSYRITAAAATNPADRDMIGRNVSIWRNETTKRLRRFYFKNKWFAFYIVVSFTLIAIYCWLFHYWFWYFTKKSSFYQLSSIFTILINFA